MSRIKNMDRRWVWIILAGIMIILRLIASFFPQVVETVYSRGIFQIIRYFTDFTFALSPIPLLYVFISLFIGWRVYVYFKKKKNPKTSFRSKTINFIFSLSAFISAMIFFFILLWGFNYSRISIEKQLKISPETLTDGELEMEFHRAADVLFKAFSDYEKIRDGDDHDLNNLENKMRTEVSKTLRKFGYPTPGRVRARLLKPKGILMRISTAGVYLPWVGECHIDAGLHPIQIPNVMAHEFAHGFGITDEGSCNFIALHTCLNSDNLFYKYSAALSYWKTVASNYKSSNPKKYEQFKAEMPKGIWEDIQAINKNIDQYPDIFPVFRDFFYNSFLKSQGISEGLKNYSRVIKLEVAYQKANTEK